MPHTPDHKGLKGRLKTDRLSASERSKLRTLRRQKKSGSLSGSQLAEFKDLVAPQPLMEDMIGEPEPIEPIEPPQIDNTLEGDGLAGLANTFKYGGRVRKKKKKRI